jgi:hypothetical protein
MISRSPVVGRLGVRRLTQPPYKAAEGQVNIL